MKKTQFKDGWRNIRKQKVSFLSIAIIAMLGVTAFLCIDYTAEGLRRNGSAVYEATNYRDIEVASTLLMTERDMDSLKGVTGVTDVEPVRYIGAEIEHGDERESINVVSLTSRINQVELKEGGRLPVGNGECVLEPDIAQRLGISVGDVVSLTESENSAYLKENTFTVTGIVAHPDHVNTVVPDLLYAVIPYDAFDGEALNGCFMRAEVTVEKPSGINRFSEQYNRIVKEVSERIEEIADFCVNRRQEELRQRLKDGFAQLEQAKAAVRDKVRIPYEEAFPSDKENRLIRWAEIREADVDDSGETARYLWMTENIRIDLNRSPDDVFRSVIRSESMPDKLLVALYLAIQQEVPPKVDGEYDYDVIRDTLENAVTAATSQYRQLADACATWDEGHTQYLKITKDGGRWLLFTEKENAGFVQMSTASANFSNLKSTFSLMFILVGALVIFATVGKMVDEQRNQIGTTKALGFFNREIFAKYIGFGVSATGIGALVGILLARFVLAPFMLGGFNKYYRFDMSRSGIVLSSTMIVFIAGILLSVGAVWLACTNLLRQPAVVLMAPKMPAAKKHKRRKNPSGKRALSLYSRLIWLNIRTDLKRVVVTIVSVAGCCALVVVGLTLRSAIRGSVTKQYSEITDYDFCVNYDSTASATVAEDIENVLGTTGVAYTDVYRVGVTYQISDLQVAELLCGDIEEINEFYHLNDWKTGKTLSPTNRGVYLQRRFAEMYQLDVGSVLELSEGGVKTAVVRVAGVFENYIGRSIVMSRQYYQTVFGEAPVSNAFLVRSEGKTDADRLQEALQSVAGFENITISDSDRSIIESSTSMTDIVVMLFILMAAMMAGVVQLNLVNMYILQKKRELTIMRVNGFTVKEVVNYMLRETVVTTAIGIVLGIGAGIGVAYSIIRTLEQSFLQFDRGVDVWACLIGAAMTVLFTTIVNAIALRNTKNLKLTDVA